MKFEHTHTIRRKKVMLVEVPARIAGNKFVCAKCEFGKHFSNDGTECKYGEECDLDKTNVFVTEQNLPALVLDIIAAKLTA